MRFLAFLAIYFLLAIYFPPFTAALVYSTYLLPPAFLAWMVWLCWQVGSNLLEAIRP